MNTLADIKKIEDTQAKILTTEKEILEEDRAIRRLLEAVTNLKDLKRFRSLLISKISKRKIIYGLLVTLGMVGVWRGSWYFLDLFPFLASPFVSVAFGVILLLALKKINDLTTH